MTTMKMILTTRVCAIVLPKRKFGLYYVVLDDFIQLDTTDDVDDMGIHARVNSAMRAADEEMVGEDMMLNDCSADPEELSSEDSDQDIELSPKDGVWEIRCMVISTSLSE